MGSEMCIRDRAEARAPAAAPHGACALPPQSSSVCAGSIALLGGASRDSAAAQPSGVQSDFSNGGDHDDDDDGGGGGDDDGAGAHVPTTPPQPGTARMADPPHAVRPAPEPVRPQPSAPAASAAPKRVDTTVAPGDVRVQARSSPEDVAPAASRPPAASTMSRALVPAESADSAQPPSAALVATTALGSDAGSDAGAGGAGAGVKALDAPPPSRASDGAAPVGAGGALVRARALGLTGRFAHAEGAIDVRAHAARTQQQTLAYACFPRATLHVSPASRARAGACRSAVGPTQRSFRHPSFSRPFRGARPFQRPCTHAARGARRGARLRFARRPSVRRWRRT